MAPPPRDADSRASIGAQLVRDVKAITVDIYATVVGQLGAIYVFARNLGTVLDDLSAGSWGSASKDFGTMLYNLLIPHYGYYGGAGWGAGQKNYDPWGRPLNQVDFASSGTIFSAREGATAQALDGLP